MKPDTISIAGTAPDDLALVERWRGGDERAATLLVERHGRSVARFLASLGVREEIEELVQDTFVRAFSSLEGFRAESSLRTWLFTIARNLVRDRGRAARTRRPLEELHDDLAADGSDPLAEFVAGETAARMRQAVARLTPMQREVFTLRVGEGLSYRDIADVVGSTEGASRVHYFNAMRAIKEFLDD